MSARKIRRNTEYRAEPQIGGYYAVPLKGKKFGAVKLIESDRGHRFLFLDGFWSSIPSREQVTGTMLLRNINEDILKAWFREDLPSEFVLVTSASLTDAENALRRPEGTTVFSSATEFVSYLYRQLCRLQDPETYAALIKEARQKRETRQKKIEEQKRRRKQTLTLAQFAREKPFSHWSDRWPKSVVKAVHTLFQDAAMELIALGSSPSKKRCVAAIKKIVVQLNELERDQECIETEEREELVSKIEELADLVGLKNEDECLTGARDW